MELHKICRICLKSDLLVSIYSPAFLLRPIEMIEKLNICKIDDNLPKFLCQSCLYRLLDAYNLQELALASERQLRQYFGNDLTGTCTNTNQCLMQTDIFPKKNASEGGNFCSSFCDIFHSNEIQSHQQHIDETDIMNDVEIDVSSLTRSEAEDTLSEVFVDAQINCHYETETSRFAGTIIGNDPVEFQSTIKTSANTKNEAFGTKISRSRKSRVSKVAEKCLECNKTFTTSGYLTLHKQYVHSGEKPFRCKLCSRRFAQISNLRLHQRIHSGERRFQCEVCASFFTTSSNLKAHSLTHKESRDHKCDQCKKCFKSIRELRRHEPLHRTKKEICNICQKTFSKRTYLSAHMLTVHRNIKKHKCKDCSKDFASKSNLKCHMRVHSGEKPFQCKHCEWKFNQSSALLRHIQKKHLDRVHSGEKPFQCKHCEWKFNQSSALLRHIQKKHVDRVHSGEKPFQCKHCEWKFNQSSALLRHIQKKHVDRVHSGEKPFQCKHCEWKFNQSSALLRHIQKKHVDSKDIKEPSPMPQESVYEYEKCLKPASDTKNLVSYQLPYDNPAISKNYDSIIPAAAPMYISSIPATNYEYNKVENSLYMQSR